MPAADFLTAPSSTVDHPAARRRRRVQAGAAVLIASALTLLPAATASAHVRVIPDTTSADGFAKVTFRVPDESSSAGTTKVEVALPVDAPFSSVTTMPVPGWTAAVVTTALPKPVDVGGATLTEAPAKVVWTADAGVQIAPGQLQEFSMVAGPLPAPGTEVSLPATQTYSDGSVVVWDQVAADGGAEPELPAPILVVPAAEEDAAATATSDTKPAPTATAEASTATAASAQPADTLARVLGGLGLALGAVALAFAAARRRVPRT